MNNSLSYRGYYTVIEYSHEDQVLHGRIEGIDDLVNFESERADEIEKEFHRAVDDYLQFCKDVGKKPDKAYRGIFNVRVSPLIHRRAAEQAARSGITLNQFVASAIESKLNRPYAFAEGEQPSYDPM